MILFIIKKATAIYRVSNFILILLLINIPQVSAQELQTYCFPKSVSLRDVRQSLSLLLLPRDIVDSRDSDNCLDIVTSPDRGKLFEKYLSKRYDQVMDPSNGSKTRITNPNVDCRLDLKTTRKATIDSNTFKLGNQNALSKSESTNNRVSVMEMLIGQGIASEFEAGPEKLKVTCNLIGNDSANLVFSYIEKNAASATTQVVLKKGEWLNIASVKKDLNGKIQTVGIPQMEMSQSEGVSVTVYELQIK